MFFDVFEFHETDLIKVVIINLEGLIIIQQNVSNVTIIFLIKILLGGVFLRALLYIR